MLQWRRFVHYGTIDFFNRHMTTLFADDFHYFHLVELPLKLQQGAGAVAARATRELEPLCVRIIDSDNAYTYQPRAETVDILAGTEAALVIELDQACWSLLREGAVAAAEARRCFGVDCRGVDHASMTQWRVALEIIYGR